MTKLKLALTSLLLLTVVLSINAQQQRYKDIKQDYKWSECNVKRDSRTYKPTLAIIANVFVPGLGYFYIDEPVRGGLVIGGQALSYSAYTIGIAMTIINAYGGDYPAQLIKSLVLSGGTCSFAILLWSIYDVLKITRIKNFAINQGNTAKIQISPLIQQVHLPLNTSLNLGASLKISF